jgi:hypothetical protein
MNRVKCEVCGALVTRGEATMRSVNLQLRAYCPEHAPAPVTGPRAPWAAGARVPAQRRAPEVER